MVFSTCPSGVDELAECYCLGRLDSQTSAAFEDHYIVCPDCALAATKAFRFVEAFRKLRNPTVNKIEPDRKNC